MVSAGQPVPIPCTGIKPSSIPELGSERVIGFASYCVAILFNERYCMARHACTSIYLAVKPKSAP